MESLKIRIQTSSHRNFPRSLISAFLRLFKEEGIYGFYKGLPLLLLRQVPNTIIKFTVFESCVGVFYKKVFTKEKYDYSIRTKLFVSFSSGIIAGSVCSLTSNPADVILSKLNVGADNSQLSLKITKIVADLGFWGLWRGLSIRILIVSCLSGLEWLIYDSFKTLVGLDTTGGKHD
jgi:solute carrier family 25 phosphate transporter 3